MTDFKEALKETLRNEGVYSKVTNDAGGETYKGIARNMNGSWDGWQIVDMMKDKPNFPENTVGNTELEARVERFYKTNYWEKLQCDKMNSQDIASTIFDFGVNAGVRTSAVLAQSVVGAEMDGNIGPDSLTKINQADANMFMALFTLAKVRRYIHIVEKNKLNQKFFYGWIRRTMGLN